VGVGVGELIMASERLFMFFGVWIYRRKRHDSGTPMTAFGHKLSIPDGCLQEAWLFLAAGSNLNLVGVALHRSWRSMCLIARHLNYHFRAG
jgi:hypothetical protein